MQNPPRNPAEALTSIQEMFKHALLARMSRDSSRMPSYEDGFYEGIESVSMLVVAFIATSLEVIEEMPDPKDVKDYLLATMDSELFNFMCDFHKATHIYASGSANCPSLQKHEQSLINIARKKTIEGMAEAALRAKPNPNIKPN